MTEYLVNKCGTFAQAGQHLKRRHASAKAAADSGSPGAPLPARTASTRRVCSFMSAVPTTSPGVRTASRAWEDEAMALDDIPSRFVLDVVREMSPRTGALVERRTRALVQRAREHDSRRVRRYIPARAQFDAVWDGAGPSMGRPLPRLGVTEWDRSAIRGQRLRSKRHPLNVFLTRLPTATTRTARSPEPSVGASRPPRDGATLCRYGDEVVEARRCRARRPRSLKSTRPSSAAAASRLARSIASSSTGAATAASLAHIAEDRDLRPGCDQGIGDPFDPNPRAPAISALLPCDPLQSEDAVGTRELAEAQCHHAGVQHHIAILSFAADIWLGVGSRLCVVWPPVGYPDLPMTGRGCGPLCLDAVLHAD